MTPEDAAALRRQVGAAQAEADDARAKLAAATEQLRIGAANERRRADRGDAAKYRDRVAELVRHFVVNARERWLARGKKIDAGELPGWVHTWEIRARVGA